MLGFALENPEFTDDIITAVEPTVGVLCGSEIQPTSLESLNHRNWNEHGKDCGLETLYRINGHTLRIKVRNHLANLDKLSWKSTAVAEVCLKGQSQFGRNYVNYTVTS